MAYKPPNTPDNYQLGKYPGGTTVYLIGREAAKQRYTHEAKISITSAAGNVYPLTSNNKFQILDFDKVPEEWLNYFKRDNPILLKEFRAWYKQPAVKSEPTPDDYYILQYNHSSSNIYAVLREDFQFSPPKIKSSKDISNWCETVTTRCTTNGSFTLKKFPQLSSEVKAELQKLNPERYKEWEEFYMKKYPNMQPLKPVFKLGKDPSLCQIQNNGTGHFVFLRHLHSPTVWKSQSKSVLTEYPVADHRYLQKDFTNWPDATKYAKQCLKDYQPELYKQFEQYYSELERKKVAEPLWINIPGSYNMSGKTSNMFYLYTNGRGWELARKEAIHGMAMEPQPDDKVMLVKVSDYSMREVKHSYITQFVALKFENLNQDQKATFAKQNGYLYNQWVKKCEVGSDLDINEKAMEADYKSSIATLGRHTNCIIQAENAAMRQWADMQGKLWNSMYDSVGISVDRVHTPLYVAGIDAYDQSAKDESVVSIWGKDLHDKLVNRLSELEWGADLYNAHIIYWMRHSKIGRPVPQSEGIMTQINRQYSPNLKQQNDEIINVPTKIIAVTSGQECTGNSISSIRRAPTVTEKYTGNRPEPCRGKKSSRSCKIG